MIDEKKLIEEIVNIPSECLDSYSVSSVQQGIQYGCATRQNEIIDIINRQPKIDWIPCEERLPSETMLCLVTVENRMQKNPIIMWWIDGKEEQVSMFDDKKGHWKEQWCKVIAWQPLPQPYKKEGAENDE